MDTDNPHILFSEFVSSILLTTREISCYEIMKMMSNFCDKYPYYLIVEPVDNYNILSPIILMDNSKIMIRPELNYDTKININDKRISLYNYLLINSSSVVLNFLRNKYISSKNDVIKQDCKLEAKKGLLTKVKTKLSKSVR